MPRRAPLRGDAADDGLRTGPSGRGSPSRWIPPGTSTVCHGARAQKANSKGKQNRRVKPEAVGRSEGLSSTNIAEAETRVTRQERSEANIDAVCEEVLLSSGLSEEAYERYGLTANRAGTYLAWFRAVSKEYPDKSATEILAHLVETTHGHEGKWFAAAKEARLFDEVLALASRSPCDRRR